MKILGYLRLKFRVRVVIDFEDKRISNFAIEFFCVKMKNSA